MAQVADLGECSLHDRWRTVGREVVRGLLGCSGAKPPRSDAHAEQRW